MPNLMCNVNTCGHNKHNLCCKDGIQVGGSEAFVSETTCCESFIEKTKEFLNSTEEPKAAMPVNCEAVNCVYNELGMVTGATVREDITARIFERFCVGK